MGKDERKSRKSKSGRTPKPVFPPELPPKIRDVFAEHPELTAPASGPAPRTGSEEQLWDLGRVLQQQSVLRARQAEIGKSLGDAAALETGQTLALPGKPTPTDPPPAG